MPRRRDVESGSQFLHDLSNLFFWAFQEQYVLLKCFFEHLRITLVGEPIIVLLASFNCSARFESLTSVSLWKVGSTADFI